MNKLFYLIAFVFTNIFVSTAQGKEVIVLGEIREEVSGAPVQGASVRLSGSPYMVTSARDGSFLLRLPEKAIYRLMASHLSFVTWMKEIRYKEEDTLRLAIRLQVKANQLGTVDVFAKQVPETLVGKPNYSVYDFDFYDDKLILLTAENTLNKAQLQLSNYQGKIFAYYNLPKSAGAAKQFFHDYEGYTELICQDTVLRLDVFNTDLIVGSVPRKQFEGQVKPVMDTLKGHLYYSNQWDKYPAFNYYYLSQNDTISRVLSSITNEDLMKLYRFEYYYLPSGMQLEARRMADYYKTDKHIIAAMISGFTQSMFYEPLYAPLFVMNDTICIFNHHNDFLYHYNKETKLMDSVKITYHHPKNWREWKKQLFVDEAQNKVYAFFSKDGHHYLKQIDHRSGHEILTYKLTHHSAEKIKIRDGYVYYVYRPFGSTQERFLYREKIHKQ